MLYQLIYGSSESIRFSSLELAELLRKARAGNSARGITGMLLYHDHCFLQILEGEQARVEALFERISQDSRHSGVTVFHRGPCAQREFGEWSMAYHEPSATEAADFDGFQQITQVAPGEIRNAKVRVFLNAFRRMTRLSEA